jgi:hypothetical protein
VERGVRNTRVQDGYRGEWNQANQRDGQGIEYYADGSIYVGYWVAGKRSGRGRITRADGEVYEGDWKDNVPHGKGQVTQRD